MIKPVLAFAGFAAMAACAARPDGVSEASGAPRAPQCFLANEVNAYTAGPDGFVNVRVGADRWFALHLGSDCPGMDWLMQIAIRPRDSNWLCEGENSYLIAPDPVGMHRNCMVGDIRRLSPGEVAGRRGTDSGHRQEKQA